MPSNNSKYTDEMRERTAKFIIESGKSATSVAKKVAVYPLSRTLFDVHVQKIY